MDLEIKQGLTTVQVICHFNVLWKLVRQNTNISIFPPPPTKKEQAMPMATLLSTNKAQATPLAMVFNFVGISFVGHEASFAAFLCCLFKLNVLQESDYTATVSRIFKRQVHQTRDSRNLSCKFQLLNSHRNLHISAFIMQTPTSQLSCYHANSLLNLHASQLSWKLVQVSSLSSTFIIQSHFPTFMLSYKLSPLIL